MTSINTTATTYPGIQSARAPSTMLAFLRFLFSRYARTITFWGLGISAYTLLLIASFPAFEGTSALDVSQYPEGMREAFNLQSLDTIEPYLSSQVFSFLPLVLAFLPVTAFASAIVGAEERGSLDILFGNPLPRPIFVIATWLAVALLMLVMLGIVGLLSYGAAVVMDVDLELAKAMLAPLNLLPITMLFGGIALVLSAFVRQRAIAVGVPVGVMFLMYLLDIIGKISESFEPLRNISAFKAYGDALQDGMPWGGFILLLAIAIGLAALAIPVFQRRDIYT